jgi:hypothetical protein
MQYGRTEKDQQGDKKWKIYKFLRLSKTEVNDIIVGLNLILDNEAAMFKGTETRIIRLRNRLEKLNQSL